MEPVLNESNQIHYVDSSDMIEFIDKNSDMEWNDVCDFVRDNNICDGYGPTFWNKYEIINSPQHYNEEQVKWVGAFFEAHPWIDRMMIVFDS
jgi:hypothetical protein